MSNLRIPTRQAFHACVPIPDLADGHAFVRAGLGFASLPFSMIEGDLQSGTLILIDPVDSPPDGRDVILLSVVYPRDSLPGPAARWFINRLKMEESRHLVGNPMPAVGSSTIGQRDSDNRRRPRRTR